MNLKEHLIIFDEGSDLSGIQLIVEDEPVLVIGKGSHAKVFARGLRELGISFEVRHTKKEDVVLTSGELYRAVGMGISKVGEDWFTLCCGSLGYCMQVNKEHLEQLRPYFGNYRLVKDPDEP